jgi:hypothetical protein
MDVTQMPKLLNGTAINDAMQGVEDESQLLVATKCKALMTGYDKLWRFQQWTALSLEMTVHLPVINPSTGCASRTFTQAGKHDGIIEGHGRRLLLEHKTCSEEIEDPAATYYSKLDMDSQVSQYMLQAWQEGGKLDGTLYDVIRKPTISPKKISKADIKAIFATKEYFGREVSQATIEDLALSGVRENHELYFNRLVRDTLDRPNRYFQRKLIYRTDGEVVEFADELWQISKTILGANRENIHFPTRAACMNYNTPCEYLGVCSGHDTLESDKWEKVNQVHGELDGDYENGGRSVLTNSRIKCFQLCRRKHNYRYGLGIRRRGDEETEPLFFGTLMHESLRAWWSEYLKEEDNGNHNTDSAGGIDRSTKTAIP